MISAILLAAGQSKRMGDENKLTKKIKNIPLIKHSINNILSSSIDELIVVLGHQKTTIEKLIDKNKRTKVVFNKHFENGMSSSIKTGLNELSGNTKSFFICLSDMPLVTYDVYNLIIKSKHKNEIIIPTYEEQQGNPVLFNISMKEKIMLINGDAGAKKIFEKNKNKVFNLAINNPSIAKGFDTQEDFKSYC